MRTVSPWSDPDNPWLAELWEDVYKCDLSDLLNSTGRACARGGSLNNLVCPSLPRLSSRVYDAVYAFAVALHRLIDENCSAGFSDKGILPKCITGPLLLSYLHRSSFDGVTGKIHFNADGSSREDFVVRQFQTVGSRYVAAAIGTWNVTTLTVDVDIEKLIRVSTTERWSSNATTRTLVSVCSLPCREGEYVINGDVSCCWTCKTCRDDEKVNTNRTGCESCPPL